MPVSHTLQSEVDSGVRVAGPGQHAPTAAGHRGARPRSSDPVSTSQVLAVAPTVQPAGARSEATPPSFSLVGKKVGRYVVDRLLGKGGMSTVWRAVHAELGGEVAIKVLAPEAVRGDEELERFFREAKVSAQLNHDHVVKVIDYARDPEVGSYIVMELLNGRSLDRVLTAEGPLEEGRSLALALQITDALIAAHANGIIHRDLKPANIFVTRTLGTEVVKVVDFGIAKLPSSDVSLTRPGEIFGTPLYMSPEQWDHKPITEASDIYSLGVVLYEMLAGKPPINGKAVTQLLVNVATTEPPPISSHRPSISADLDAIVQRCLRKRPNERFASMRDLRDALERVRDGLDLTHTMSSLGSAPWTVPPQPRTMRRALIGVATLLLALTAAVVTVSFTGHHASSPAPTDTAPPPEEMLPPPTLELPTPSETSPSASTAQPSSSAPTTRKAAPVTSVRRARPAPTPSHARAKSSAAPRGEDDLLRKD
jgi:serine/threonine-protein kinase